MWKQLKNSLIKKNVGSLKVISTEKGSNVPSPTSDKVCFTHFVIRIPLEKA